MAIENILNIEQVTHCIRGCFLLYCVGDLADYAMAYFSRMEEEPFLLIKGFSPRIILNNSYHSCLDHIALNTIRNEAAQDT